MMTETEFLQYSDQLFTYLEDEIDQAGWDLDCQIQGNVLTIETQDGSQIIINRHTPNQELWIAAKSGGYHFAYHNQQWLSSREQKDFFSVLNQILSETLNENIDIPVFQAA